MPDKFKISDNDKSYFLTFETLGGVDVFTKKEQKLLVIQSLEDYRTNKGLEIYAYALMSNHLHIICRAREGFDLSTIIKDFKKNTSKAIIKEIRKGIDSRKKWLLEIFSKAFDHLKPNKRYKVWKGNNHAILIYSDDFLFQKLDHIHNNPVEEMIVSKASDYLFSSARNYAGMENLLEVTILKHLP